MKKILLFILCSPSLAFTSEALESLGERMFNDIRFSQYFHTVSAGNVNHELKVGSSELDTIVIRGHESPSPFAGQAISCASCHMVDQASLQTPGGMRGYNDFAQLTKIPQRGDTKKLTLRNTPSLIGIGSKYARNRFSHYDGEFHDHSETVLGNFTGRNMGWLKKDKKSALRNIVMIIKEDNGLGELALEFGGAYRKVLLGVEPSIPSEFRIPEENRIDIATASDEQILEKVISYVTAYMNGIDFEKDDVGIYTGSPYDEFLRINNISAEPKNSLSIVAYNRELLRDFSNLKSPKFVKTKRFETHDKEFGFNELEWKGLKIFFNINQTKKSSRGMCLNCHMAPMFSDQFFHNVGTTQDEYDNHHGKGSFINLPVPTYTERKKDEFLATRPNISNKMDVDLGMWNFFGRAGKSTLTDYVTKQLCRPEDDCSIGRLLPYMIARIKTPSLRNLGHSVPYLHNGSKSTLTEVIDLYISSSELKRQGKLRNGAPQLRMMSIKNEDKPSLKAFLDSLNENYE
jgi:cytochrome c peroxidase